MPNGGYLHNPAQEDDMREAQMMKAANIYVKEWVLTKAGRTRFSKKNSIKALEYLSDKFDELLGTGWRDYLLNEHIPKEKKIHRGEYD